MVVYVVDSPRVELGATQRREPDTAETLVEKATVKYAVIALSFWLTFVTCPLERPIPWLGGPQ